MLFVMDIPSIQRRNDHFSFNSVTAYGEKIMEPIERLTDARPCSSVAGKGHKWFGGWGWMAVCVLVVIGAMLAFSGEFGGRLTVGAWLPLLFVLPCAIMMFMCMKNMGGNQSGADNSIAGTDARKTPTKDQR